ncbi:Uncharacterized membrane protein [Paenibacillus sp. UNCCL117]|uniref:hypothetical protein n=1 Tax=unclassified Paenibacillus TaxID=185978 RepID=UPI0008864E36|nr:MULTISPECIES: hypothetical protein [unclassified Paenibacillus]SDD79994.1 Uncharacterized membrane protein [Paenibacillus sp. cl123]SFW53320.1 Uncharacterized membrane protein [Paenibacillus sp. UNCCL117]
MSDHPSDQAEPPHSKAPEDADVKEHRTIAAAAYILFFLPLLAAKQSRFAMYHCNQGLILLLAALACNIVLGLIPLLGLFLVPLANLGILALAVLGILNALNGAIKPLPLLGHLSLIKLPA